MEQIKAVLKETKFLKNPDSTKPEEEYILNVEAKTAHALTSLSFHGDRERYLGITRKILAVLEPGPSEQILESLGRIEELLKQENQKT